MSAVETMSKLGEELGKIEEEMDSLGALGTPPPMKHSDTRDSISSVDSDVSLSYDRRGSAESTGGAATEGGAGDVSDSGSDAGGGKDSGCEVAPEPGEPPEPPFTPPTEELADRIVAQVEFYFSDANITKDAFLLKHVKRNKEGYVSLKLISSFKRVKHLTKDWRVVAAALQRSSRLEINEAGTKLRRLDPLPQYDETTPSRTVVAVNLPTERPSIEGVSRLFSPCGEIALIRVLRPGNPIPADVRQFLNKNPHLGGHACALVEFAESAGARAALGMRQAGEGSLQVFELARTAGPAERKKAKDGKRPSLYRQTSEQEYSPCCSGSEAELEYWMRGDPRYRLRRGSSGCAMPPWAPRRPSACSHSSDSSGYCWTPRRLSSASRDSGAWSDAYLGRRSSDCSSSGAEYGGARRWSGGPTWGQRSRSNSAALCPEPLVRPPAGPDGTRGFHNASRQRRISDLALYSR